VFSGPEAPLVNSYKSTADAKALEAIALFYGALAQLELLDTTKLVEGVAATERSAEMAKTKLASENFVKAAAAFEAAARSCEAFRARFTDSERVAFLVRDISGFRQLGKLVDAIVGQISSGTLPSLNAVHVAMSEISDTLVFSKYRAQAHAGTVGHHPHK
jgi:hypothetical protein